jgi:hypothetical protein
VGWGDYLKTELGKQSPLKWPLGSSKYSEELYPETIELKRRDIEFLADCLRNIRGELEKLARSSRTEFASNRTESPMSSAMGVLQIAR